MKNKPTTETAMTGFARIAAMVLAFLVSMTLVEAKAISGKVTNAKGKAMEGVMISAFTKDFNQVKTISVFSQNDGSFTIGGLRDRKYYVRARLMGQLDEWQHCQSTSEAKCLQRGMFYHRPSNIECSTDILTMYRAKLQ